MRGATREVRVPASHPALPGHFPDAPIVPAAWQLVLVEQACREAIDARLAIVGLAAARFRAPWLPGADVTITVREVAADRIQFVVASFEGRIADGTLIVRAADE